jgi:hypothetical protein
MKKGGYWIILLSIIIISVFISGIGVDVTKAYHNSTNITIGIDGINQTINTITAANFVFPPHTYASGLSLNPGHNINQIWVSVKDGEMNLSAALSSTNKLCPANPIKSSYTSSPIDKSQPYHYANEIQLSSGKTLQEAINLGDFCYSWYTNTISCSVTCGGGTRTTYCSRNGTQVADNYCYGTKPSVSCNTQGCVWTVERMGCIPASCSVFCPYPALTNTSCSPRNSTKMCGYNAGCSQAYGECRIFFYRCK